MVNAALAGDEPIVIEVDGPPMAFFEIPLDFFTNDNAELEPETSEGAVRLVQRVQYYGFSYIEKDAQTATLRAGLLLTAVRERLMRVTKTSFIWWRKRPEATRNGDRHKVNLRLGTSPSLPGDFWVSAGARPYRDGLIIPDEHGSV